MLNRRAWDQLLAGALRKGTQPLFVALIDLDHFKDYNDRHGHPAGDALLRRAAAAWRSTIRANDVLARYGGEEFAVLLAGCEEDVALEIAERLREATIDEQRVSIGVARWDGRESAARASSSAPTARSTRPRTPAATASCWRRRPRPRAGFESVRSGRRRLARILRSSDEFPAGAQSHLQPDDEERRHHDRRPTPTTPDTAQAADDRSRWIALIVLCVGMLMIVLDVTVVNVALPSIQEDLGFSQSSLAWVVNAYLIAFGGLLLLAGRLGDLISRRGVFLAGLAIFTLASIACGMAQSQEMLVAARFVQGVGGALTSAVILGMIVTMFPEPREQAKAIGVYGFVASAGGSIGLLVGGVLTRVDQLALDLLREHPDRDRHRRARDAPAREGQGRSASARAPTCSARCSSPRRSCCSSTRSSTRPPSSAGARSARSCSSASRSR